MSTLTESKIHQLYSKYKKKAQSSLKEGHKNDCLRYLIVAAHTGYSFYMDYKDDELEDVLEQLSKHIVHNDDKKERRQDESVFYDSFSYDNGGLVQQYLGALISCGYKIRYITPNVTVLNTNSAIGTMLRNYAHAEIVIEQQNLSPFKRAQFIYNSITETDARRLFIHTSPNAAVANTAFYALPQTIKKYKINLTDHTFWIGTRFIDYSLEFRPYGGMLSVLRRGIAREKVLHIPFYPIMNHTEFKGFPDEARGKVEMFSGASYYKIFDKEDTFFKLSKAILDACPNVVLLFAGFGDAKVLDEKLQKYELTGRFIPIGQRSDITEVFEHCDIFLNTYPLGGGLMSQYAAQLAKPIVSYATPGTFLVEEFVCQTRQMIISDRSFEAVVERVRHLVADPMYRRSYGQEIHSCVISPAQFNELFAQCMEDGKNPVPYAEEEPFVEVINDLQGKLEIENITKGFQISFVKSLGIIPSLIQCPSFVFDAISSVIKSNRLLKVLKNHI